MSNKRSVTTNYLVPSRMPLDSALANGTVSGDVERAEARTAANLSRALQNLKFTYNRATGYADMPQNEDLVQDVTQTNIDQEMVDETGYLMGAGQYYSSNTKSPWDGGMYAGKSRTVAQAENKAYSKAEELLIEALEYGSDPATLIAELNEYFPGSVMDRGDTQHPAIRLAKLLNDKMNSGSLANAKRMRRGQKAKDALEDRRFN